MRPASGLFLMRCATSAIDKLTKQEITLRGGELLPVSKSRYAEVVERYMDYRF